MERTDLVLVDPAVRMKRLRYLLSADWLNLCITRIDFLMQGTQGFWKATYEAGRCG